MADEFISQKSPYIVDLDPGVYLWCACGKSSNQPFCDDSHKGTDILPKKVRVREKEEIYLCGCKQSGNKPYCDDTHLSL